MLSSETIKTLFHYHYNYKAKAKKKVVFTVTCQKNWVGRSGLLLFFFFFNSNVYVWLSLCFKSAIL